MQNMFKVPSKLNKNISLKVIPGHFATNHSHINYYIDMTTLKFRKSEAENIAKCFVREYTNNTYVDTIVCMDSCEVIGAFLADELTKAGIMSLNSHKTIYIVSPEFNSNGQIIFRDNIQPMIKNKNVILLLASATTGKTIRKSVECIDYYGGKICGVSAIFSAVSNVDNIKINSIFTKEEIKDYETFPHIECPYCKGGHKLDAIVNSYGYSQL